MRLLRLSPLRLALGVGLVVAAARWSGCALLDMIDSRSIDYRLLQRGVELASPDVVIVAIDDVSLQAVGRWPWPRATRGRLIDRLAEAGAAVIGVDAVDSEKGSSAWLDELPERLESLDDRSWSRARSELRAMPSGERVLAEAVRGSGRSVLGYYLLFEGPFQPVQNEVATYSVYSTGSPSHDGVPLARSAVSNLPELSDAAREIGYFNVIPDPDGFVRRFPLTLRSDDKFLVPLSLAMLGVYRPDAPLVIHLAEFGVDFIRFGATVIPVAENGELLLNYRGPGRTFEHVSASAVLDGKVPPETFRDKLVLVGVTASAVYDVRVTPFDPVFPGVEIHATVLDNVLRGDFLWQPKFVVVFEIVAILVSTIFLGLVLRYVRGIAGSLVGFGLLGIYFVTSQRVFLAYQVPLSLAYPVVAIFVAYAAVVVHQYVVEERKKRTLRSALDLHLSPTIARHVRSNPQMLKLGGEKRELTVLFSDIRGFTSLSEHLDPERMIEVLNEYFTRMTDVIFRHDGTLDKYMGDGLMAVWGAPVATLDHADRACRAALEMVEELLDLRIEFERRGFPLLDIGIGVNTGLMVVGNMGSARRLSYTAIGDNVNLGSRLEGLNKVYGTRVIVSEATRHAAGDAVVARELDLVRVKGRVQPVPIFEILATGKEAARWSPMVERFAAALKLYRHRQWSEAATTLQAILAVWSDDGPSRLYLERCRAMAESPPAPDWDGVTVMESK